LIFVVAHRTSINGASVYVLGNGGDESKIYWFAKIGGFDDQKYVPEDRYTPVFWNSTLIGKLIPFNSEGYALFRNGQPTTTIFKEYRPGAITVYSEHLKYPKNDTNSRQQELSLMYSSPSFLSNNSRIISAVLIYKVNYSSYFQKP
jgi:dolichyl-diphosphooligosaccharide---protein glycosyltransferase